MIEYKTGNLLAEDAEAIVNTVNCVGVMGRGIALQFKKSYPDNFNAYAEACKQKEVVPGKMFVFEMSSLTNPRYIINFPTKRHWRGKSSLEDVESGLEDLFRFINDNKIRSIAIPPLGSGLGGLDWNDVRHLIEKELDNLPDTRVIVFETKGAPAADKMVRTKKAPKMTTGRAALLELVDRYLRGLLDPFVSLLEVHKLMYFMQEAGEPLRLKYSKGLYGPYADNLRHVLNAIEGHMIKGYADGGDDPTKSLELVPEAVKDANIFIKEHTDTLNRFERVKELVSGFETPFGLELLATVHWVMQKEQATSQEEVMEKVYSWNARKKQFTSRQLGIAMDVLSAKGWVSGL